METSPRAAWLGSTALTILVRCPCGHRNYFPRRAWERYRRAPCDNCRAVISYSSLRVMARGGVAVTASLQERGEIIEALDEAQAAFERAARKLQRTGQGARAHQALNYAQYAAGLKCLLEGDWAGETPTAPVPPPA